MQISSLDDDSKDVNLYDLVGGENLEKDDLILLRDALNKLNDSEKQLIIKLKL